MEVPEIRKNYCTRKSIISLINTMVVRTLKKCNSYHKVSIYLSSRHKPFTKVIGLLLRTHIRSCAWEMGNRRCGVTSYCPNAQQYWCCCINDRTSTHHECIQLRICMVLSLLPLLYLHLYLLLYLFLLLLLYLFLLLLLLYHHHLHLRH